MDKKSSNKKSGKAGKSQHQEPRGIDWDKYEEMYAKTGFSKQFGKGDQKSKGNKLPGRTVSLKSRRSTAKIGTVNSGKADSTDRKPVYRDRNETSKQTRTDGRQDSFKQNGKGRAERRNRSQAEMIGNDQQEMRNRLVTFIVLNVIPTVLTAIEQSRKRIMSLQRENSQESQLPVKQSVHLIENVEAVIIRGRITANSFL